MMAFSHMVFGLSTWGLVSATTGVEPGPLGFAAAFVGSVAPDIDHPHSWIGRRLLPISVPVSAIFGHRGITHSLLAVIGFAFVIAMYSNLAGGLIFAFSVGYLSHLLGDLISNSGIPAFWPIKRKISFHLINTGGFSEVVFMVAFVFGVGYLLTHGVSTEIFTIEATF